MCNSRIGGMDNNDHVSKIDVKNITLKCVPSKLGRKGDPRMHKALEVRLNDPKLSLFDALKLGGFKFHWEGEVSYDEDHVLLSQRKNQLSRRIRLYKQSIEKNSLTEGLPDRTASTSIPEQEERKKSSSLGSKKRGRGNQSSLPSKRQGFNEDNGSLCAHDSSSSLSSGGNIDIATAHQLSFDGHVNMTMPPLDKNFPAPAPAFGAPALQKEILTKPSEILAPVVSSSSSLSPPDTEAEKMNRALTMYSRNSSALMQKCLQSSGFSLEQIENSKDMYIEFRKRALDNERMKLQEIMMNPNLTSYKTISPSNTVQLSQVMSHSSTVPPHNHTQQSSGWNLSQMPPINGSTSLPQQSLSYIHVNHSYQTDTNPNHDPNYSGRPMLTYSHNTNICKNSATCGPKVLDLKESDMEDDDWKTILYRSESTLDKILGLIKK